MVSYQAPLTLKATPVCASRHVSTSFVAIRGADGALHSSANVRISQSGNTDFSSHLRSATSHSRPAAATENYATFPSAQPTDRESIPPELHNDVNEDRGSDSEDWDAGEGKNDDDVDHGIRQRNQAPSPESSSEAGAPRVQAVIEQRPRRFPLLGNQEKKELRAYAHQLGKKLKMQQVWWGKWGVTPTLAKAIGDTLEANEILKLKVLENSPKEVWEVEGELELLTECQVVGRIGRTLLLYRPSLTRMRNAREAREREERREREGEEGEERTRGRGGAEGTVGRWGKERGG